MHIGHDPTPIAHLADAPTRVSAAGVGDFTTAWNNLLGLLPPGLATGLAVIGAAIIVVTLGVWAWKANHGGPRGVKSMPWARMIVGLALAAPAWIIPVLLLIFGVLAKLAVSVAEGLAHLIG